MAKTPEGIVKDGIIATLKEHNIMYSMKTTMGYGKSGWPDFDIVLAGIYVTVEAKFAAKKKGPTALQRETMRGILASGGVPLIVDINSLEAFARFIGAVVEDSARRSATPPRVRLQASLRGLLFQE